MPRPPPRLNDHLAKLRESLPGRSPLKNFFTRSIAPGLATFALRLRRHGRGHEARVHLTGGGDQPAVAGSGISPTFSFVLNW